MAFSSLTFEAMGVFAVQKIDEFHSTQLGFERRLAAAERDFISIGRNVASFGSFVASTPAATVTRLTDTLEEQILDSQRMQGYVEDLAEDMADLRSDTAYNQQHVDLHEGQITTMGEEMVEVEQDIRQLKKDVKDLKDFKKIRVRKNSGPMQKQLANTQKQLIKQQKDMKAMSNKINILEYEKRISDNQREVLSKYALELNAKMEARQLEQAAALSGNMDHFMTRLCKLEEAVTASTSSSGFAEAMKVVGTNQLLKLREEIQDIKATNEQGRSKAEEYLHDMNALLEQAGQHSVAIAHRAEEAAQLVNEIEDNDLEAIAHTCQVIQERVTRWEEEGLLSKTDPRTGHSLGQTVLQMDVAELKRQNMIIHKRGELLMWSVVEANELSRSSVGADSSYRQHLWRHCPEP